MDKYVYIINVNSLILFHVVWPYANILQIIIDEKRVVHTAHHIGTN